MQNRTDKSSIDLDTADPSRKAEFLRLLEAAYHDLYGAGLSVVGNRDDADDVVQEACALLWQKFDEYQEGSNFKKWALTITFNIAKAISRRQRQRRGYGLCDEALLKAAQMKTSGSELFELHREILQKCLQKMQQGDRNFLLGCYRHSSTLTRYARKLGMPVETIYTRLKRYRRRLADCMNRHMREGES